MRLRGHTTLTNPVRQTLYNVWKEKKKRKKENRWIVSEELRGEKRGIA